MNLEQEVRKVIRDVEDFPKKGIVFKDITPIFRYPDLCKQIINKSVKKVNKNNVDAVAGIESRGFLFGASIAAQAGVPFILIRKKGKLPYHTVSYKYSLEYGTAEIEMHKDAIQKGDKVLIHDDLLATGGSASAAAELILKQGGVIAGFDFLIELSFLEGREMLTKYSENISTLVAY